MPYRSSHRTRGLLTPPGFGPLNCVGAPGAPAAAARQHASQPWSASWATCANEASKSSFSDAMRRQKGLESGCEARQRLVDAANLRQQGIQLKQDYDSGPRPVLKLADKLCEQPHLHARASKGCPVHCCVVSLLGSALEIELAGIHTRLWVAEPHLREQSGLPTALCHQQ